MEFEQLTNFRSLEGIENKHGGKIKKNVLLRSGELSKLTFHDVVRLKDVYNLKEIIDMRTTSEIAASPNIPIPGTISHHIDFFQHKEEDDAPSLEHMMADHLHSADQHMMDIYADFLTTPAGLEGYRKFFDYLLEVEDGSLLWHCFAGKDRTGTSAALLLSALDVDEEVILDDYLKTNASRKKDNDALLAQLEAQGVPDEKRAQVETMLYVKPVYLTSFFTKITELHGSVDNFLTNTLKITPEQKNQLQEKFLD